jgi:hypothetical protein
VNAALRATAILETLQNHEPTVFQLAASALARSYSGDMGKYRVVVITAADEAPPSEGIRYAVKIMEPGFPELTVAAFSSEAQAKRWIAIRERRPQDT